MRILSNAFPTNLPDSEQISQGGPANFERLFLQYIKDSNLPHEWVGVMLEGVSADAVRLRHICTEQQSSYWRLYVPRKLLKRVVKAADKKVDPNKLWHKPIARLEKFIRQQQPDVVFLNGFGILNWMLLKAARHAGVPVVVQHAGIWNKELKVHQDRYTEQGRVLLEDMERESSELSSIEIFLNHWSHDYYRDNVASGSVRKTEIVPLPFDFGSFEQLSATAQPTQFAFDRKYRHIGIIARWDKIKNHEAVLAMAKEARRQKLPWKFHSIVTIPDSEEYAAKKKSYERYVHVLPPANRAGISDFCRSVDMLLLPSLFDVSPTVVLEAVSLGTPIVISPTVGHVRTFLSNGGGAWVVDPADARAAVQAIAGIIGKDIPAELKQAINDLHDHRKVFDTYLRLFSEARLRELPLWKVVQTLWWENIEKYFSGTSVTPEIEKVTTLVTAS